MKFNKTTLFVSAALLLSSLFLSGCEVKITEGPPSSPESTVVEATDAIVETQPDPLAPKEEPSKTEPATQTPTEAPTESKTNNAVHSLDDNGAVVLEKKEEYDDDALIAAAQDLFISACNTEWKYTVGCPYNVDYNSFINNEFDWQFYKITDKNITSFKDIESDYYKVFSSEYQNKLADLYKEKDGNVYALCGERGSNVYYSGSEITAIKNKNDKEITFTVVNHYSGSDFTGNEPYTETEDFSVIIYDDGTWRAGKFKLPF